MEIRFSFLRIRTSFLLLVCLLLALCRDVVIFYAVIASVLHEAGHLLGFVLFGVQPKSVTLSLQGMIIEVGEEYRVSYKAECFVAALGPLTNGILFFAFYGVLPVFATVNLCIGIFNLLPVKSLDGGRILNFLLMLFLKENAVRIICFVISLLIVIPLVAAGGILGYFFRNISLMVTCVYLISLLIMSDK